tara:strand:+ start:971 stop:1207 length:237 start_codon:yes stop_codon:yes gene_type:complete
LALLKVMLFAQNLLRPRASRPGVGPAGLLHSASAQVVVDETTTAISKQAGQGSCTTSAATTSKCASERCRRTEFQIST